jgi:hypothetical protein
MLGTIREAVAGNVAAQIEQVASRSLNGTGTGSCPTPPSATHAASGLRLATSADAGGAAISPIRVLAVVKSKRGP